ncbi:VOC family protein [Paraburkholderia sp. GAS334]|uniref:VOC family protein n=1 Tax=Paraburkholderia sp. GAS334 TaxID=3035131 RepID=UPI003D195B6B
MFSHVVVGTNDLEKAKRFYDAVLGALGHDESFDDDGQCRRYVYRADSSTTRILPPCFECVRLPPAATTRPQVSICCTRYAQNVLPQSVDADTGTTGVANGGKSVEDPPGVRGAQAGGLYLAYLRDPDGNKLCALHRMPA